MKAAGDRRADRWPEYGAVVDLDARLTVLGSLNMDISVTVPTLPGPGATVLGGAAAIAPGGKGANQAVAAARLGADSGIHVRMVGCVGDDDFGRTLKATLTSEGIDDRAVRTVPGAPTGIAMITVDESGENIITVAPGANREVGAPEIAALSESAAAGPVSVLVISAEVPIPVIRAALGTMSAEPPGASGSVSDPGKTGDPGGARPLTVLNLAPAPPAEEAAGILKARPDWLVVNQSEAAAVLGRPVSGLAASSRPAPATRWSPPARPARLITAKAGHRAERSRLSPFAPSIPWAPGTRSWARSRLRSRAESRRGKPSPRRPRPAPPPRRGQARRRGCRAPPIFAPRRVLRGRSISPSHKPSYATR
jgi:hypothetical protein